MSADGGEVYGSASADGHAKDKIRRLLLKEFLNVAETCTMITRESN